jgi:hypothetical protein
MMALISDYPVEQIHEYGLPPARVIIGLQPHMKSRVNSMTFDLIETFENSVKGKAKQSAANMVPKTPLQNGDTLQNVVKDGGRSNIEGDESSQLDFDLLFCVVCSTPTSFPQVKV